MMPENATDFMPFFGTDIGWCSLIKPQGYTPRLLVVPPPFRGHKHMMSALSGKGDAKNMTEGREVAWIWY